MDDLYWSYAAAATYWLLVLFWGTIVYCYGREYRRLRRLSPLFGLLILVIFIDGARTLFESLYFGVSYTGRTPLLPRQVFETLALPRYVIIPKLLNLLAAATVLFLMTRRWLPEIARELEYHRRVERLYAELREAQAARQMLAQMLVHDMRIPLTNLLTGLRTAQSLRNEQMDAELLRGAIRGGERLLHMINELLDLQRMEARELPLRREPVDLAALVGEARSEVSELALERGVEIREQAGGGAFPVDRDLLRRVLVNLAGNAVRFSPAGSRVTIEAGRDEGGVTFRVRDEGPGIPPELRERIFQPFYQIPGRDRAAAGGTGLGLAFCRMAVEAHAGAIGVESAPGEGSTFWVRLPAKEEADAAVAAVAGAGRR